MYWVHTTELWAFVSYHGKASLFLIFQNQSALFSVRDLEQVKLRHLSPYCVLCVILAELCTSEMVFGITSAISMLITELSFTEQALQFLV
jgi:hypothetical protein